jgi:hypothetical protein
VSVTIAAEASLEVETSTTSLSSASTFGNFTGTTNLIYKISTTASTGAGSIVLQVTTDFSLANGPSVPSPPNGGDTLGYTCTVSRLSFSKYRYI